MIKQWFKSLEKREQYLLLVAAVAIVFYLLFGVFYRGLVDSRDRYQKENVQQEKTLQWMRGAVQTIQALKGQGVSAGASGQSLAQLVENAAKVADVRVGRFQPKDDNEAQVWLEREEFGKVLVFLSQLEIENGLLLDDVAISYANTPGIVNLRLKFSK